MADDTMGYLAIDETDPEFARVVAEAQETLPEFRALLRLPGEANALVCIKTRVHWGGESALLWLLVIRATPTGFDASSFEVSRELPGMPINTRLAVDSAHVADWMYNMDGLLHGGFSLRAQRARLAAEHHAAFDEWIGVREYV